MEDSQRGCTMASGHSPVDDTKVGQNESQRGFANAACEFIGSRFTCLAQLDHCHDRQPYVHIKGVRLPKTHKLRCCCCISCELEQAARPGSRDAANEYDYGTNSPPRDTRVLQQGLI